MTPHAADTLAAVVITIAAVLVSIGCVIAWRVGER